MKGELPLLQKAQKLQEELMMMMPEEVGDEPLALQKYLVNNAKKIGLMVAGLAAQKYGKALDKEQEILVNIADIVSNLYAMESAVLRTEKAIKTTGLEKNKQKCYTLKYSAKKHSTKSKHMRKKHLSQLKTATCYA